MMYVLWYIAVATMVFLVLLRHSSEAMTVKPNVNQTDQSSTTKSSKPKLLLLSIAGLRGDYLTHINLTNMNHMIANGTRAKYVQNSVNVLDIVTHYSIATGLYPESHGIISNTMFDPKLNRVFNSKTRANSEWWVNVHPIWLEIENRSALCHWPGVYGPMVSTLHCSQRKSLRADIEQALQWLRNDVEFVLLYSDDIKKAALRWGPYSQEAIDEVKKFDSIMKFVLEKTGDLHVNILLTSDSGVTDLTNRHIELDRCLDPKSYILTQPQATLLFYPKRGYTVQELYQNLTKCKHVKVYLKEELPERSHFSNNRRIPPIIAFVPLGSIVQSSKRLHLGSSGYNMGGTGYHPGYEVMRGVFIGYGSSFQPGLKFRAIKNVDIYGLMCHLLGITPRPNNGSYDVVKSMFNDMTSFAADVTGDVIHAGVMTPEVMTPDVITPKVNITGVSTRPITYLARIEMNVKVLFWILVVVTALLLLFCCVGCFATMYNNHKQGYTRRTKVREHGAKSLLLNNSSDEE